MRIVIKKIIKRASTRKRCALIVVSSILGMFQHPNKVMHSATNAYSFNLTMALGYELRELKQQSANFSSDIY